MGGLNLNELLRYGFSGASAMFLLLLCFKEPLAWSLTTDGNLIEGVIGVLLPLTFGALSYTVYRALFYPALHILVSKIAGRKGTIVERTIAQWKGQTKVGALQPRMTEWGA